MGPIERPKLTEYEARTAKHVPPVFVWDASYETGLTEVDQQHRRLVDIINHVDRLLRVDTPLVVLEPTLDELTEYAKYHFATEERLMDELRCEPAHVERHKRAHLAFVQQVSTMRSQTQANPLEFVPTLLRFLSTWLVHHILTTDQALARQVFIIRGGAPLAYAHEAAGQSDPASEALLDALNRLYDHVARRNLDLVDLNRQLQAREKELRTIQEELHEANRNLEKRIEEGESRRAAARKAFDAQSQSHAAVIAADGAAGDRATRDVVDAISFASGNIDTVRTCVSDLFRVIEEYEKVRAPSARTNADDMRDLRDAEILERLRRIVFEILDESKVRLAQADEVMRRP